jgi:glucose/arabinose dehydrogenase
MTIRQKRVVIIAVFAFITIGTIGYAYRFELFNTFSPINTPAPQIQQHNTDNTNTSTAQFEIVATGLDIPWDIAFLPDETMLVTQRPGTLVHIEEDRTIPIDGVEHAGEGGLLGIALHPDFTENNFVYLYQTTRAPDGLTNRVVRYTYQDGTLRQDKMIIDDIPGAVYHDGGRIRFGPEGKLWVTVGDAGDTGAAQDPQKLNGSILRLNADGSIPEDNPFANAVYSYGHRNPQGLTWDAKGRLWSSEHGRSGARSGMDEINLIKPGANYGWPTIEGDQTQSDMQTPKAHSGPDVTWAPASTQYYNGSIFFGGLRGATLYEAIIDGEEVREIKEHFAGQFGRIRAVVLGPDKHLYITTSNKDGRGNPAPDDDKIIRINPELLK